MKSQNGHNRNDNPNRSTAPEPDYNKLWTLSNFLSILRVLLVVPFVLFYEQNDKVAAFIVLIVAVSTDWFDGKVARWTNTVSDWGKILDPMADKLTAAFTGLYLLYRGELPIWFVLLIVLRDAILFLGGMYARHKKHIITTSLPSGKWAVGFLAGAIGGVVFPIQSAELKLAIETAIWAATALFLISFVQYAHRFFDLLNDKPIKNL